MARSSRPGAGLGRGGTVIGTGLPEASGGAVVDRLQEITNEETDFALSLAGNAVIKDTLSGYFFRILVILIPCAVLLILGVFYLIIRNRRLTVLAMIPAWLATLWTFGTLFWSGRDLNLVTILSPIFILVIGSAYGLHYVTRYQENITPYPDRRERTSEPGRGWRVPAHSGRWLVRRRATHRPGQHDRGGRRAARRLPRR